MTLDEIRHMEFYQIILQNGEEKRKPIHKSLEVCPLCMLAAYNKVVRAKDSLNAADSKHE